MKTLIAGLMLSALFMQTNANPSTAVMDACRHTSSMSPNVLYTSIDAGAFEVIEDEEAKKTSTVLHHGKDTVGT